MAAARDLSACSRFLVLRQMSHQRLWLLIFSWWSLWSAGTDCAPVCSAESSRAFGAAYSLVWWPTLIVCPDLLVAWTLLSRLKTEQLGGVDERAFVGVSVAHLVLCGVGNLSMICKQRGQSMRAWATEALAIVLLEVASAVISSARVLALWALSALPFGGEHLASFLFSSSMGISTLLMLFQLPELISAIFKPLGWSDCLQPASRRLAALAHTIDGWVHDLVDQRPRRAHVVIMPPMPTTPTQARVKWPPKLPTTGPPLSTGELETLAAKYPDLVCPVSHAFPVEPAVGPSGVTFDRASIAAAVTATGKDPVSNRPCSLFDIRPNYALRSVIDDYVVQLRSASIEQNTPLPPPSRARRTSKRRRQAPVESPPGKRLRPLPARTRKRRASE